MAFSIFPYLPRGIRHPKRYSIAKRPRHVKIARRDAGLYTAALNVPRSLSGTFSKTIAGTSHSVRQHHLDALSGDGGVNEVSESPL